MRNLFRTPRLRLPPVLPAAVPTTGPRHDGPGDGGAVGRDDHTDQTVFHLCAVLRRPIESTQYAVSWRR